MFKRPEGTYDLGENTIKNILADEANPLNRISEIVPNDSKILDIGAGSGLLALVLEKLKKNIIIDGIEPNQHAANSAISHYRHFHIGYAQEFFSQIQFENYDYIVLADVLEHMNDPLHFLRELSDHSSETTRIVISLPNVAFGSTRIAFLNGDFDYVDSGILERSHLRFFTLKTVTSFISASGLNIERLQYLKRDLFSTEIQLAKYPLNYFCYRKIIKDNLSFVYQFLIVLKKNSCTTIHEEYGGKMRFQLAKYIKNKITYIISARQ
jgi:2-polyprenyl-3-methyl-5-hydroxy-6-metoxy-1,4-benzoquinol methylase